MSTGQKDVFSVRAEVVLRVLFTAKLLVNAPLLLLIQVSKILLDVIIACDRRNKGITTIRSLIKLKLPECLIIVDFYHFLGTLLKRLD